MSSHPGSSSPAVGARAGRRLSTETKAAPKTTEFALTLLAIVGVLVAAAVIKGGDAPDDVDQFIARQAWLYVTILVAAYSIGRGLAKSGSREPYFEGGSNDARRD